MKKNIFEKIYEENKEESYEDPEVEVFYLYEYEIKSGKELTDVIESEMIAVCNSIGFIPDGDEEWLEVFKCITKNIKERLRG